MKSACFPHHEAVFQWKSEPCPLLPTCNYSGFPYFHFGNSILIALRVAFVYNCCIIYALSTYPRVTQNRRNSWFVILTLPHQIKITLSVIFDFAKCRCHHPLLRATRSMKTRQIFIRLIMSVNKQLQLDCILARSPNSRKQYYDLMCLN